MKLNPETQINVDDALIEETARAYSIEPIAWDMAQQSIGNVVVRLLTPGQTFYAKYYNSAHRQEKIQDEITLVNTIPRELVPVPALQPLSDGSGYVTKIEKDLKTHHTTLTESAPGSHPDAYDIKFIDQLAVAHAVIHDTRIQQSLCEPLNIELDYNFADTCASKDFEHADVVAKQYLAELDSNKDNLPSGLTHLDITLRNILVSGSVLSGIIDFEDTSIAPYIFCLAGTLWDIKESTARSDLIQKYIDSYQEHRELTSAEMANLDKMIFLRGWLALHGTILTQGVNNKAYHQNNLLNEMVNGS